MYGRTWAADMRASALRPSWRTSGWTRAGAPASWQVRASPPPLRCGRGKVSASLGRMSRTGADDTPAAATRARFGATTISSSSSLSPITTTSSGAARLAGVAFCCLAGVVLAPPAATGAEGGAAAFAGPVPADMPMAAPMAAPPAAGFALAGFPKKLLRTGHSGGARCQPLIGQASRWTLLRLGSALGRTGCRVFRRSTWRRSAHESRTAHCCSPATAAAGCEGAKVRGG